MDATYASSSSTSSLLKDFPNSASVILVFFHTNSAIDGNSADVDSYHSASALGGTCIAIGTNGTSGKS